MARFYQSLKALANEYFFANRILSARPILSSFNPRLNLAAAPISGQNAAMLE
jgi:hypothetical protein